MSARRPRVSLVVIATGRYHEFVPTLVKGAKAHVLGLERIFVMSDAAPHRDKRVIWLPWGHMPWPYPTLLRYRAMTAYRDILSTSEMLLYLDADMRVQRNLQFQQMDGLLAVQHPGYAGARPDEFPYERRVKSTSCIEVGEGTSYFAGGFQGGHAAAYLDACGTMAGWIQADLSNGVVPLWHDESAWNRYCLTHPPELVLPHGYCSPEHYEETDAFVVALDKDHDLLRETPPASPPEPARGWQCLRSKVVRSARRAVERLGSSE